MTTKPTGAILRYIRGMVDAETTRNLSDAELLQRFAERREEAAFAALVKRHGAHVWSVCQHLLHHEQDAEDAFQATFLVLARRAKSIRNTEAIGSFLHGVAYRVAVRAKQKTRDRQAQERRVERPAAEPPPDQLAWRELQAMLDEEVARLPKKYRGPFVLCCLEGKTRVEAARELGCKEGTVSSRIARARERLQARLAKRGVSLSAALCALALWKQTMAAAVPAIVAANVVQAALGSAEIVSTAAAAMAEGVLHLMGWSKLKIAGVLFLGLSLLAAGAGVGRHLAVPPPETAAKEAPAIPAEARKDRYGDPLPPGALARLGTIRQRAPDSHLAVTADGKEIVALSREMTVRRFDAQTGALRSVRQLPVSNTFGGSNWLSPHGRFALAADISKTRKYHLDLWDLEQGKIQKTLPLSGNPWGTAFSADERLIAVTDSSVDNQMHRVIIWDQKTTKSREFWSKKKELYQTSFAPLVVLSPDGKRLVACHLDQILRCWDVESAKLLWQAEKKTYYPWIFFSPDGSTLVIPSGSKSITIREAGTGKFRESKRPSTKEVRFPIGFSPDGRYMAFQTGLEEIVLCEPGKDEISFRFPRPPYQVSRRLTRPTIPRNRT